MYSRCQLSSEYKTVEHTLILFSHFFPKYTLNVFWHFGLYIISSYNSFWLHYFYFIHNNFETHLQGIFKSLPPTCVITFILHVSQRKIDGFDAKKIPLIRDKLQEQQMQYFQLSKQTLKQTEQQQTTSSTITTKGWEATEGQPNQNEPSQSIIVIIIVVNINSINQL